MNVLAAHKKDPAAKLDYSIDWSRWLDGDTIAISTWTVPDGISETEATHTASIATIWLSGGIAGSEYLITNRIATASGREDERTLRIVVEDR